jgi:flagellar biosynthesis protein FlhA
VHLAPAIVQQIYGPAKELDVIALDPTLERLVAQALIEPARRRARPRRRRHADAQRRRYRRAQEDIGLPACLLVPDLIRTPMARLLKRAAPRLKVLGHSEIPDTHSIRIASVIGATA